MVATEEESTVATAAPLMPIFNVYMNIGAITMFSRLVMAMAYVALFISPSALRILDPTKLKRIAKDPMNKICAYSVASVNTEAAPIKYKMSFKNKSSIAGMIMESKPVIRTECSPALFARCWFFAPMQRAISDVVPVPSPCPIPTITMYIGTVNPRAANALAPSPATHMLSTI